MHQEMHFPGRVSATNLLSPDFAALAKSYGAYGVAIEEGTDFAKAFADAQNSGGPALIHIKVDPDALTPTLSLASFQ